MSTRIEPLLTVDDLDAMPDDGNRREIIEGELFVSRTPDLLHQTISGNLFFGVKNYLANNPIGQIWATPGIILSELDALIPDLAFVSNERLAVIAPAKRIIGAPDLVIEILSPGLDNERRDRIVKRQLYGKFGVKEYWVVDPEKRSIEVYLLEGRTLKLHNTFGEQDQLTSSLLPGFTCEVVAVFK